MNDDTPATREPGGKPVAANPGQHSIENLLRHLDPAPDEETERFVAAIYADRREGAAATGR